MIPLLSQGNVQISVDTSNGSEYSDYIYNSRYGNRLYRINTDLKWRFYARFYYDYDIYSNRYQKKYSKLNTDLKMNASLILMNQIQTYSTNLMIDKIILSKSSIFNLILYKI